MTCPILLPLLFHIGISQAQELPTVAVGAPNTVMKVGVDRTPPFAYQSLDGDWEGISVNIWEHAAKNAGLQQDDAFFEGNPLGIPADKKTKEARQVTHLIFDHLWKTRTMSRHDAYVWMQKQMGLIPEEAHIGRFNQAQCEALIRLVQGAFS